MNCKKIALCSVFPATMLLVAGVANPNGPVGEIVTALLGLTTALLGVALSILAQTTSETLS